MASSPLPAGSMAAACATKNYATDAAMSNRMNNATTHSFRETPLQLSDCVQLSGPLQQRCVAQNKNVGPVVLHYVVRRYHLCKRIASPIPVLDQFCSSLILALMSSTAALSASTDFSVGIP